MDGLEGHVWVQARRTYCDRGHWEWGNQGLMVDREQLPTPSYYFMHREHALAEAEEWLARMQGAKSGSPYVSSIETDREFTQPHGAQLGWTWHKQGEDRLVAQALHEGKLATLCLTQAQARGGPIFVLSVEGGLEFDSADRFPRVYLDLDRAMKETEAFLAWRLLEQPAEIPGPLQDPARPVGELLQSTGNPRVRRPWR